MLHSTLKSKATEDVCVLFRAENHAWNYVCDCGIASELSVKDCRDTAAIFISHTHIDHFSNFDWILRHQLAVGRKVVICGPPGIAKNVQSKLLAYNWVLLETDEHAVSYQVHEIHENGKIEVYWLRATRWELEKTNEYFSDICYENESFFVKYTHLNHSIPSIAYLFEEHPKAKMKLENCPFKAGKWMGELKKAFLSNDFEAQIEVEGQLFAAKDLFQYIENERGYRLGYIMDHRADAENHEKILALFSEADECFIETYYREMEREFAAKNFHSVAAESAKVMRNAKVKKVHPVHHSRRYHDEVERQGLLDEFFAVFNANE